MHLRPEEKIIRVVKRHLTPYLLRIFGIVLLALPLYLLAYYAIEAVSEARNSTTIILIIYGVISFFVSLIVIIFSIDYLFDKLIISNYRIVWVDWRSLFLRDEHEAELRDIQDVKTQENGILARLPIFDYGILSIETAASSTSIKFKDCPNPEEVKHFILVKTKAPIQPTPSSSAPIS